jgi:hypothetical protein
MMLTIVLLLFVGIISALSLALFRLCVYDRRLTWLQAHRRADELLRSVLTWEQYRRLRRQGYIDIPSPHIPGRTYRVPRDPTLVRVIEGGRLTTYLCLQPVDKVPDADIVVMHKLMIETDEETYVQLANKIKVM